MTERQPPDGESRRRLATLIGGYRATQMIGVAARLGLADLLAGDPRTAPDLARVTGSHPDALARLLSGLVNIGVLAEPSAGRFALTPLGHLLRADVPGSQLAWARWEGDTSYRAWGALDVSVAGGGTGFEHVFGRPFFDGLEAEPDRGAVFNGAMADFSAAIATAVAGEYDFSGRDTVVDVGGGLGHVLATVLRAHPGLRGVLFEAPAVAGAAGAYLAGAGLGGRAEVVTGDFFTAVPAGAGLYLLCHIVHDWDDQRATRLLRVCREAAPPDGVLLIVEKLMPEPMRAGALPPGTDVNMLVLTGGRERSEREYEALLRGAGWRLARVLPTASVSSLFEAVPA